VTQGHIPGQKRHAAVRTRGAGSLLHSTEEMTVMPEDENLHKIEHSMDRLGTTRLPPTPLSTAIQANSVTVISVSFITLHVSSPVDNIVTKNIQLATNQEYNILSSKQRRMAQ